MAFAAVLGCASAAWAESAEQHQGTHEGADFLISMPGNWSGGLVMYAHGYQGELPGRGNVEPSPWVTISKNIAWAASGYRSITYRPDWFLEDILSLRAHFIRQFGPPRWTMIHGLSMGGHITVAALELHPDKFQAGLIECGIVDGVGLIEWLYAYTAGAEYFSAAPLLDTPRPAFNTVVNEKILPALGSPGSYTDHGRLFDNVVKHLAGGDLPLRLDGLSRRYILNLNSRDPGTLSAREFARHADTRNTLRHRSWTGTRRRDAEPRDQACRTGPRCAAADHQSGVCGVHRPAPRPAPSPFMKRPTSAYPSPCNKTTAVESRRRGPASSWSNAR